MYASESVVEDLRRLGDLAESAGHPGAEATRQEALDAARTLVGRTGTTTAHWHLAYATVSLSRLVERRAGPAAALDLHVETLASMRLLAAAQDDIEAEVGLVGALLRVGAATRSKQGRVAARAFNEEAAERARSLLAASGDERAERFLLLALMSLSDASVESGDKEAALGSCEEALAIAKRRIEARPSADARRDLAIAEGSLAKLVLATRGAEAARTLAAEQERLFGELAREAATLEAQVEHAIAISELADAHTDGARRHALKAEAVRLLRAAVDQAPVASHRCVLSAALAGLAEVTAGVEGHDQAIAYLRESESHLRAAIEEHDVPEWRRDLSRLMGKIGEAIEVAHGPKAALAALTEGLRIARELHEAAPTPANCVTIVYALHRFCGASAVADRPYGARGLGEELISHVEAHGTFSPDLRLAGITQRRDLLLGRLLGPEPWARAFASEHLDPSRAAAMVPTFHDLHARTEAWASSVGPKGRGWPESILLIVARCHLAAEHPAKALDLCRDVEPIITAQLADGAPVCPLIARLLLVRARAGAALNQPGAAAAFAEAMAAARAAEDGAPASRRAFPVAAWFAAEELRRRGRVAEADAALAEGHEAAQAFARTLREDGAAILDAYERSLLISPA